MTIALTHGGTTIYTSPRASDDVLVGTVQGIVRLRHDQTGAWREVGRALEGQHIHALVQGPDRGVWFAGAYKTGIFASSDDGVTWEPRSSGLTETSVFSLAVAAQPDGRVRLYAGTEPAHLFVSDDQGRQWRELPGLLEAPSRPTWRFAGEPFAAHLKHISVSPTDANTVFASVEVGGLHRSTDGGQTFTELAVPHPDIHRTVFDPRDPNRIYVTGGAGLTLSCDGGDTWQELFPRETALGRYPDALVQSPRDPNWMMVCSSEWGPRSWVVERRAPGGGIGRSTDGGVTWEPSFNGLPTPRFHGSIEALCLEETPSGRSLFAVDTDGVLAWSADGGDRWQIIAQIPPVSKSVHAEMAAGGGPTPLKFSDSEIYVNGQRVAVPSA